MAIITRVGKIPLANTGKGLITHKDREVDGLDFRVAYKSATHAYVYVMLDSSILQKALDWLTRNGGEVLTVQEAAAEVQADITASGDMQVECSLGFSHTITAADRWQAVLDVVNSI